MGRRCARSCLRSRLSRCCPRSEILETRRLLATVIVNTLKDESTPGDGLTSLREAIGVSASGGMIAFQSGLVGTILLGGKELAINKSLTFTGPGADKLAISGGSLTGSVALGGGRGGLRTLLAGSGMGGAIYSAKALTISATSFSSNSAMGGLTAGLGSGAAANGGALALATTAGSTISG